jgi:hypothetical protein
MAKKTATKKKPSSVREKATPKKAPAKPKVKVPPAPVMPAPTASQRWSQAVAQRNLERDEMRNTKLRGTPLAKATVTPVGDHMVRRGTRVMALSRKQASDTTRKSWQARKQKYGRKGRASSLTFDRSRHSRTK